MGNIVISLHITKQKIFTNNGNKNKNQKTDRSGGKSEQKASCFNSELFLKFVLDDGRYELYCSAEDLKLPLIFGF